MILAGMVSLLWRCYIKKENFIQLIRAFYSSLTLTEHRNGLLRNFATACVFDILVKENFALCYKQVFATFLVKLRINITCLFISCRNCPSRVFSRLHAITYASNRLAKWYRYEFSCLRVTYKRGGDVVSQFSNFAG